MKHLPDTIDRFPRSQRIPLGFAAANSGFPVVVDSSLLAGTDTMSNDSIVYIVEDKEGPRESLQYLVESINLKTRGFASAQEFLDQFDVDAAGCLLLDVRMPGMSGMDLHERLRELGSQLPVIFLSAHGDVPMAVRAMKNGAMEFLEKPASEQVLLDLVQKAISRNAQERMEQKKHQAVRDRIATLTPRELEVMLLVVEGYSSKEIGAKLDVSHKTVEAHRARIMRKMQVKSVSQLIRDVLSLPESLDELREQHLS